MKRNVCGIALNIAVKFDVRPCTLINNTLQGIAF
jgi:hypothetical protein